MNDRRELIVRIANREGSISFLNLKKNFPNISDVTLRRDLDALDKENRIIRVHGGIKSVEIKVGNDSPLTQRSMLNIAAKRAIAMKAAQFVHRNSSIFIDSGSTCLELCRFFPHIPCLVFTSGVNCALQISRVPEVHIYLLGGMMGNDNLALSGSASLASLMHVHPNIAFIGAIGFAPGIGFTCGDEESAQLKRTAIAHSEKTVMLVDSSKLVLTDTFAFAGLSEIQAIITDSNISPEMLAYLRASTVDVIIAQIESEIK